MNGPRILPPHWREHPEPSEGRGALPWAVLGLAAALAIFGIVYIARSSLDGAARLGDGRSLQELAARAAGPRAADGAALYASMCAGCHQAAGQGLPGVFPPLAGTPSIIGPDRRLSAIVLHGVTGPLTVNGTVYQGVMPGFREQLSDADVAAVLTHVRSNWGNAAPAVTADLVGQVRQQTSGRTSPFQGDNELGALR